MGIFSGSCFSFAGTQDLPEKILIELILKHGGKFESQVTESVTHVLSSDSMASVWGNPYKLQFFPDFDNQVSAATVYSIPIVSGAFIEACISANRLLDVADFLIFGAPSEQLETKSKLDPVKFFLVYYFK